MAGDQHIEFVVVDSGEDFFSALSGVGASAEGDGRETTISPAAMTFCFGEPYDGIAIGVCLAKEDCFDGREFVRKRDAAIERDGRVANGDAAEVFFIFLHFASSVCVQFLVLHASGTFGDVSLMASSSGSRLFEAAYLRLVVGRVGLGGKAAKFVHVSARGIGGDDERLRPSLEHFREAEVMVSVPVGDDDTALTGLD